MHIDIGVFFVRMRALLEECVQRNNCSTANLNKYEYREKYAYAPMIFPNVFLYHILSLSNAQAQLRGGLACPL